MTIVEIDLEYAQFQIYLCISVILSHAANKRKSLNHEISHEKTYRTHEIPTRKYFGRTKYSREKIFDPRSTHEKKFRTHEISTKAQ